MLYILLLVPCWKSRDIYLLKIMLKLTTIEEIVVVLKVEDNFENFGYIFINLKLSLSNTFCKQSWKISERYLHSCYCILQLK